MSLFNLGFRPFFLFGAVFSLLAILIWVDLFLGHLSYKTAFAQPVLWHAHEMLFGYVIAVISGFLLTAIKNWTGRATLNGLGLAVLVLIWLSTRVLAFSPNISLASLFFLEMLFFIVLLVALAKPIIQSGNYQNLAIVFKVLLLMLSDAAFYLGALEILPEGERLGITSALYLIVAIILTLGRRVIPFFIEKGVSSAVTLRQSVLVDRMSLILMLLFWLSELIYPAATLGSGFALSLFILHAWRLQGWYTRQIWQQPLLWSLFVAYTFIIFGFLLRASQIVTTLSPSLAIHAFTYGGVGLITVSMMARVSLGHTGRNIYATSKRIFWICSFLSIGAVVRVIFPILASEHLIIWLRLSQFSWVIAFALFLWKYLPVLALARADGKPG